MALRKKQENTSAALRTARRRLTASVLTTLLSLALVSAAVFEGVSFGWLALPTREAASDGQGLSSAQFDNATKDGHDTYMFKLNDPTKKDGDGQGVRIEDGASVTMNTYDKVFPLRNGKTPIILRAVLSPGYAEKARIGETVELVLRCGSDSLFRDGYDMDGDGKIDENHGEAEDVPRNEEGKYDPNGKTDGIIDYLSNVVNVRAAYINGLVKTEVEETYDKTIYKSADDYIYCSAMDYFEKTEENGTEPFTFVNDVPSEGIDRWEPSEGSWYDEPAVNETSFSQRKSASASEKIETKEDGTTVTRYYQYAGGHLIGDGSNYLYVSNGNLAATTDQSVAKAVLWSLPDGNSGRISCESNGTTYYLRVSGYTLSLTSRYNSATSWTFSEVSGTETRISCSVRSGFGFTTYYLSYNSGWSVTTSQTSLKIYKLEQYHDHYYKLGGFTQAKSIHLNVSLNEAAEDNGYFYVYLMLDYDPTLVAKYLRDNDLRWSINSTEIEFADNFTIEVTEKQTT